MYPSENLSEHPKGRNFKLENLQETPDLVNRMLEHLLTTCRATGVVTFSIEHDDPEKANSGRINFYLDEERGSIAVKIHTGERCLTGTLRFPGRNLKQVHFSMKKNCPAEKCHYNTKGEPAHKIIPFEKPGKKPKAKVDLRQERRGLWTIPVSPMPVVRHVPEPDADEKLAAMGVQIAELEMTIFMLHRQIADERMRTGYFGPLPMPE